MAKTRRQKLSPREQQILDILYRAGNMTVAQVREAMSDPPSYDAVRTTLRILEDKGFVRHRTDGPRYIYQPAIPQKSAQRAALKHLVETFFQGSADKAALALLELSGKNITEAELDDLEEWLKRKGPDS